MKAVVTTDWHLDRLERLFPNALELQFNELCKPFDYALAHNIHNVIVPGDLCENPEFSSPAQAMLNSLLTKYDRKLRIKIIPGNHDVMMKDANSLQPLEVLVKRNRIKVEVYTKPTHVEIDGVHVNFLPFPYTAKDKVYKGTSLNVAHLEWVGAVRDNGVSRFKEGHSKTNGRDFWIMGHLHTPQYLAKPRVLYIGTQYQTNFGENEDKSFCVIDAKMRNGQLEVKFERVAQRQAFRLINLRITKPSELAQVDDNPLHLYKLHLKGIKPPKNWLLQHPNVVSMTGVVQQAMDEENTPQPLSPKIDRRAVVVTMMKDRGLTKPQMKRGIEILKEIKAIE